MKHLAPPNFFIPKCSSCLKTSAPPLLGHICPPTSPPGKWHKKFLLLDLLLAPCRQGLLAPPNFFVPKCSPCLKTPAPPLLGHICQPTSPPGKWRKKFLLLASCRQGLLAPPNFFVPKCSPCLKTSAPPLLGHICPPTSPLGKWRKKFLLLYLLLAPCRQGLLAPPNFLSQNVPHA